MSLPFLKPKDKSVAGLIIKHRAPDEKPEEDQDDKSAAIESCMSALIRAVHANDAKAAAEAFQDAQDVLEQLPHEEGEHIEKHSYDDQNKKAAE